jgi:hypothetical protein
MDKEQKPKRKGLPIWLWIIIGFFVLAIIGSISNRNAPSTPTTEPSSVSPQQSSAPIPPPTIPPPTIPPVQVSATTLTADYVNNQFAADEEYKGKILDVSGTVSDIDRDIFGNPFIEFYTGQGMENALFTFSNNNAASLAKISVGEPLTIQATCKGKSGTAVDMEDCSIIPNGQESTQASATPTVQPPTPIVQSQAIQSNNDVVAAGETANTITGLTLNQQYSELYNYLDPDDQATTSQQEFITSQQTPGYVSGSYTYSIDYADIVMVPTWADKGTGNTYNNVAKVPVTWAGKTSGKSVTLIMHLIKASDGTWRTFLDWPAQ